MNVKTFKKGVVLGVAILAICALSVPAVFAQAVPGGDLNPNAIPKYVTPLVIPPVMDNNGTTHQYDIAVRQFQQQILPGGVWNVITGRTDAFPATTVWSYGPAVDNLPDATGLNGSLPAGAPAIIAGVAPAPNSQFNYPAYTVENIKDTTTSVDWINDLKQNFGAGPNYLSHLLPIDQTLHWANPGADCIDGTPRTDCRGQNPDPYMGPVPIIVHVHGAHSTPESDGYPEAWYLPDPTGSNFTCVTDPALADNVTNFVCEGTLVNKYNPPAMTNPTHGVGHFTYQNDQPTATFWYHDHALGMTRNNVYAGPAGFWLLRESDGGETGLGAGMVLPGPAPVYGENLATTNFPASLAGSREKYREIPIVIQDRSFNADGSLFYPANRAFFEGLGDGQIPGAPGNTGAGLNIDTIPTDASDISPIWNPEAFFNTMVVNGTTWPELEVAPAIYRFRLLNGCNSRFLNLALFEVTKSGKVKKGKEIPFFQIGAEQSLLPQVVMIQTGFATPLVPGAPLPKNTTRMVPAPFAEQALLMGLAERADVLVDFRGLKNGTIVRMINTAPDAPFGGFPDIPADPATTGQVMQFRVNSALLGQGATDPGTATPATDPWNLVLSLPDPTQDALPSTNTRDLALLEEESAVVCVNVNVATGVISQDYTAVPDGLGNCVLIDTPAVLAASVPFAPKAAVLGYNGSTNPTVQLWSDDVQTNPGFMDTETWELWNWTVDGHPIHLHLVKFKVVDRQVIGGAAARPPQPTEAGWKDTVIALPGEITRVKSTFDIAGLYVWHCHIVEHEDNEMMVPYCVGAQNANGCQNLTFAAP